ncbi:hypothetical protein CBL_08611 [Carabus blaptoides fortunei]
MNIDERLAEILEDYPVIWDRRSDIVKARYKAIRERYRKEKIKIDQCTRSGVGQMDFEPWHLMKTLKFLDMVQTTRIGRFTVHTTIPHISDSQTDIFCTSLSGKKQEVQDISNLTPTHPKRKRNDEIETMVNRLANAAKRISEKRTSEYDTFGLYVGQCLNKMSEDVANETIEKMNKVLYEAKKKMY